MALDKQGPYEVVVCADDELNVAEKSTYFIMANVIEANIINRSTVMAQTSRKGFQLRARTSLNRCDGSIKRVAGRRRRRRRVFV